VTNHQTFLKQNQFRTSANAYHLNRSRLSLLPSVIWGFVVFCGVLLGIIFINNFIPVKVLSVLLPFIEPQQNNLSPKDLIINQQNQLQAQQFLAASQDFGNIQNGQFLVSKTCIVELSSNKPNDIVQLADVDSQWLVPFRCNDSLQGIQLVAVSQDLTGIDNASDVIKLSKSQAIIYGNIDGIDTLELDRAWEAYIANILQSKSSYVIRLGKTQYLLSQGCGNFDQSCQLWQLDQFGLAAKLLIQDFSEFNIKGQKALQNYPIVNFSPIQDSYPESINLSMANTAKDELILLKINPEDGQVLAMITINPAQDPANFQRFVPL
jgi:hypothetical protein